MASAYMHWQNMTAHEWLCGHNHDGAPAPAHLVAQSNIARRPFFVYMLLGISVAKAATDWGRKAPSATFCTKKSTVSKRWKHSMALHAPRH